MVTPTQTMYQRLASGFGKFQKKPFAKPSYAVLANNDITYVVRILEFNGREGYLNMLYFLRTEMAITNMGGMMNIPGLVMPQFDEKKRIPWVKNDYPNVKLHFKYVINGDRMVLSTGRGVSRPDEGKISFGMPTIEGKSLRYSLMSDRLYEEVERDLTTMEI